MENAPKISVCIPVFNTESTLARALNSVATQDFTDYEIVLVNDASGGRDEKKRNCKKIAKSFKNVKYIEHRSNLGLLEARRTAVNSAEGKYICILDSDDELLPQSLSLMYNKAEQTGADIVHAGAEVIFAKAADGTSIVDRNTLEASALVYDGILTGNQIIDGFLGKKNHNGFLWAKLINRELYQKALDFIPFTNCVMAEDFLQYFFISFFAKKYCGITTPVYRYYRTEGISSIKEVSDLKKWEQICSTANVFTTIFAALKTDFALTLEQTEYVKLMSRSYLLSTIRRWKSCVQDSIKEQAYELLCEYWGKDFVDFVESNCSF